MCQILRRCLLGLLFLSVVTRAGAEEEYLSVEARRNPGDWDVEQVREERVAMLSFLAQDTNAVGQRAVTTVLGDEEAIARLEAGVMITEGDLPLLAVHFPVGDLISITGASPAGPQTSTIAPDPGGVPLVSGGVYHEDQTGAFRWSKAYDSPGATALRLHLEEMNLPTGVELYVYGFGEEFEAHGPYTGSGMNNNGSMWTNTVFADRIYLEIQGTLPPSGKAPQPLGFRVVEVAHFGGPYFAAGETQSHRADGVPSCLVDISCAGGEFDHMGSVKYAVAYMSIPTSDGHGQCTGTLVSDDTDYPPGALNIPYFLTAKHCLSSTSEASGLECYFRYFTPSCGTPAPTLQSRPRTLGSTLLRTRSENDMTFLRLSQNPPGGSVFLGWTTQSFADKQDDLHRLSHPSGLPMRYDREAYFSDPSTWYRCRSLSEYHYTRPRVGATPGGSSGSALVTADMKIAGQLFGLCYWYSRPNDCDYSEYNLISGKFSKTLPVISEWLVTPPPANDHFQNRIALTGVEGSREGSTKNGTRESGEPAHAMNTTSPTVWYQWTAPAAGTVIFSTCTDTLYDTILAAYTGSTVSSLTRVAENDDFCDKKSRLLFNVVPGQTYDIAVAGFNVEQGRFTLRWTFNGTPLVVIVNNPANNSYTTNSQIAFQGAYTPISPWNPITSLEYRVNQGVWRTNVTWGSEMTLWQFFVSDLVLGQNRVDIRARDAHWTYGPIETRFVNYAIAPTLTVTSHSTNLNYLIPHVQTSVVIAGTASAPGSTVTRVFWRRADNSTVHEATGTTSWQINATNLIIGDNIFYIRAESAQGLLSNSAILSIRRDYITPPNDSFSNSILLSGSSGSVTGWTTLGSRQTGEPPHSGNTTSPTVWYRWSAPADGDYYFETCSHATFDTILAVYTGTQVASLTPVTSNDDWGGDCGTRSRVGFRAQMGQLYRIAVAGYANGSGDFILTYGVILPPTVGVSFPTRTRVTIPETQSSFTFEGSSTSEWPVDRILIRRDAGSWLEATGTDEWSFTTHGIPYGESLYAIRAVNSLGTEGPIAFKMLYRLHPPPQVIIAVPLDEEVLVPNATSLYTLTGGAYAMDTGLMGVEWRKNGGNWTTEGMSFDGSTYWSLGGVALDVGDNLIEIRTQDQTLRYSEIASRTITRVALPRPMILSPFQAIDVPYDQVYQPFGGTVGSSAVAVEWRIGSKGMWRNALLSGTFWEFEAGPLEVGPNSVQVRARNMFDEYGATALRTVTRLENPYVPGDVNQDGVLNVADVTLLARYLNRLAPLPDESLADVDQNGRVSWRDLDLLVERILK